MLATATLAFSAIASPIEVSLNFGQHFVGYLVIQSQIIFLVTFLFN
jgi:hypothetical protein